MPSNLIGHAILDLRGHAQNTEHGRGRLKEGQELFMSNDYNNKYDKNAVVVTTLDGYVVGRVPKEISMKCCTMLESIDTLSVHTKVSFVQLWDVEIKDSSNGKRYWEKQPRIKVEYMTTESGQALEKKAKRLAKKAKAWLPIELIKVSLTVTPPIAKYAGPIEKGIEEVWALSKADYKRFKTEK